MPVPAIFYVHRCELPVKSINQVGRFYHMNNVEVPHRRDRRKKSPDVSASIGGENRLRFSLAIDADTLGDFFRLLRRCGSFENLCDKIVQPDGLALLAIGSNKRRKSRERI